MQLARVFLVADQRYKLVEVNYCNTVCGKIPVRSQNDRREPEKCFQLLMLKLQQGKIRDSESGLGGDRPDTVQASVVDLEQTT